MRKKYQSSAILIALALGVAVSGLIIGISVSMSQFAKMSTQARDGKLAYQAALSGIEDGLMRYRYAKANNFVNDLLAATPMPTPGIILQPQTSKETSMSYNIDFKTSSLTVGKADQFPGHLSDPNAGTWLNLLPNAQKAKLDDPIDVDLSYYLRADAEHKLDHFEIAFTSPFQSLTQPLFTNYFTPLNVKIVNTTGSAEEQTVWETTNTDTSRNSISVASDKWGNCLSTSSCHLRIRPQIGKRVNNLPNSTAAGRIFGTGGPASGNKFIFYAIEARDITNHVIPADGNNDKPGTIILSSVGQAGKPEEGAGAYRKIEAKIDASSGNYLGLFDYGIYCGNQCTNL